MKGALKLFDIFGIAVKIHITFLLLPLIFGYLYGLRGLFLIAFVFCCVAAHELFHSLQARRFGVKVDQIILLPIGGVAGMRSIPEKPSQEFRISIAGPLFNIALTLILFFPAYYFLGLEALFNPGIETWPQTLAYAFWINPMLALFNLLPAFPMDGGRVLRSILATRMEYVKATRIAVGFGHAFAIFFGFFGFVAFHPILILIAFFIFIAASQEGMQVDLRTALRGFSVKDILPEKFFTISASAPLTEVLALAFHSHQEDFPVMDEGRLVGLLTRADIILSIHQFGMQKQIRDVMRRDFPVVRIDDPLTKVHSLMAEQQIKAIPVLNQGKLAGIISLEDISRVYLLVSGKK